MEETTQLIDTLIQHTLISKEEKPKAFIGKGKSQGYSLDESIQNQFALLSDQRIYLNGVNYERTNKSYKRRNVEAVVQVKDITSVSYVEHVNINYVISFFIAFLWFFIPTFGFELMGWSSNFLDTFNEYYEKIIYGIVFVLPMLIFFFLILNNKVQLLDIRYPGGNIGINVKYFGHNLVSNFRKKLVEVLDTKQQ